MELRYTTCGIWFTNYDRPFVYIKSCILDLIISWLFVRLHLERVFNGNGGLDVQAHKYLSASCVYSEHFFNSRQ